MAKKLTRSDLDQGLSLATGQKHPLVVPFEDVEVEIEWPPHIAQRLPKDFVLTLSSAGIPDQRRTLSGRTKEGAIRFAFKWRKKTRSMTLEASAGGQTVRLWDGHVAGDLDTSIDWAGHLEPLLVAEEESDVAEETPSGDS